MPRSSQAHIIGVVASDTTIDTPIATESGLLTRFSRAIAADPAVAGVTGSTGGPAGGSPNAARMFISLVPGDERDLTAMEVIGRLRQKLAALAGATLVMQPVQDLRIGGRPSSSQFQYTLRSDTLEDLEAWGPRVVRALRGMPELADVRSDQQMRGLQARLSIDRDAAARLGVTPQAIDEALYDAFGQRQVALMHRPLGQYRVVLGMEPEFLADPAAIAREKRVSRPLIVWNDASWSASSVPVSRPVSCCGKNPLGTIVYSHTVSAIVAKLTAIVSRGWASTTRSRRP